VIHKIRLQWAERRSCWNETWLNHYTRCQNMVCTLRYPI